MQAPKELDVYKRSKYEGVNTKGMKRYAWFQLVSHNLILIWVLLNISSFTFGGLLAMGFYLFFGVFSYTSLMDGHIISIPSETMKLIIGLIFILSTGIHSWPLDSFWGASYILLLYSFLSLVLTASMYYKTQKKDGKSYSLVASDVKS